MALQTSGAISLANVQTEFGGSNPISISEYYGVDSGVPTSGTISLSNFYGKSAIQVESYTYTTEYYSTGGKLGDAVVFNKLSGLTDAQRQRALGVKNVQNQGGSVIQSNLSLAIQAFPDSSGKIPAFFRPCFSVDGIAFIAADKGDWDLWWRYVRLYTSGTLIYTFDRLNVQPCELSPESQDNNASSGVLQYGQTLDCTPLLFSASTPNLTVTISNV